MCARMCVCVCVQSHQSGSVPVKHIVIGISQLVEETTEQLSEVSIVRLVLKLERTTEIQIRGKLTCREGSHRTSK